MSKEIGVMKAGLKICISIIPKTGVIKAPLILCALFISLARELMITDTWMFNKAQKGASNKPAIMIV